jgi:hypothetical protein
VNTPLFFPTPVFAAYFAEATKAKKASSFAKASTVAGGYGRQDGGQDDRQAGPAIGSSNGEGYASYEANNRPTQMPSSRPYHPPTTNQQPTMKC